jgi:ATP-binding cassette subfamily B protein
LIACGVTPVIYIITRILSKRVKRAMRRRRERESNVASTLIENVNGMALVQAYSREEAEHERFRAIIKSSTDAQVGAMRTTRLLGRVIDAAVIVSTATILYVGGRFALSGEITPGVMVLFVSYLRAIFGAFQKFSGMFLTLTQARVSAERLLELVENDMVMQDTPQAVAAPPFLGRVVFEDVSFAYQTGNEVLRNLRFTVEPGETVALVGHSGAGKSTLISLLMRFYDPRSGRILIDGHDLRNFTLKSLRDQLTIVLQNAKLFRQTVRENIAFGKPDATDAEIIDAARRAEADDFIRAMPEGYDTFIEEGGNNLSGGQKQRINIARAIIRNTPIVIMDEPVTGLDARSEAKVNAAIQRLARGKTTFIIAHKFSTIAGADKVLLLEEGQLAHYGSHEQLMRESSQYRQLYELQYGWQKKWGGAPDANGKLISTGVTVNN